MRSHFGLLVALVACSHHRALPPPALPLTPSPDASFRAAPPAVPATPLDLPDVRSAELPNGLHILVVERPALPLVTLGWAGRAARDDGTPHEAGLAALTARALNQGTRLSDGQVLAQVRINGEFLKIETDAEGTLVSVHTAAPALAAAVDLVAAAVRRPTLNPAGIHAARADQLETMYAVSLNTAYQLRDAALTGLFGIEHPPVAPLGSRADVIRFTAEAVAGFHAARYAPDTSALVAVGAVSLPQIIDLAERYFGDWPKSAATVAVESPKPAVKAPGPIQAIDGAGFQAMFALALPCAPAGDAREADFDLLATILGTVPLSRTTRLLRHEAGIAYAVHAGCQNGLRTGTFWVEFGVEAARAGDALALVLGEIRRLHREDVPQAELELAKIQLLGRIGGSLSTNASIARALSREFLLGQPPDALSRWVENVQNATSAGLRETASVYFRGPIGIAAYGLRSELEADLSRVGPVDWSRMTFSMAQ